MWSFFLPDSVSWDEVKIETYGRDAKSLVFILMKSMLLIKQIKSLKNEKINHASLRIKRIITPSGTEKSSAMCWIESFRLCWDLRRGSMPSLSTVKLVKSKRDIEKNYRTVRGSKNKGWISPQSNLKLYEETRVPVHEITAWVWSLSLARYGSMRI